MCSPKPSRRASKCIANALEGEPGAASTAEPTRPTRSTRRYRAEAGGGSEVPCLYPIPAWRTDAGEITLRRHAPNQRHPLALPCGGCLGCRASRAREWAVRCALENTYHTSTCWATLTYEEKYKPPTLSKRHLQGWLKRLRRSQTARIRFFASGEYGEKKGRPHYHAILFGLDAIRGRSAIEQTWPFGQAQVDILTPAAISYVAGYTAKKLNYRERTPREQVDPSTGEVFTHQPPFIQMSRRPGIGFQAKHEHWRSWKKTAIANGIEIPVPRYLHQAWEQNVGSEEIEELENEKAQRAYEHIMQHGHTTNLKARALAAITRHEQAAARRTL